MRIILEKYQSGHYVKGAGYDYFRPSFINKHWTWNSQKINQLNESAALRLGELNAHAKQVPNIHRFIRLHMIKESVDSSRIEGTRTGIEEMLCPEREIAFDRWDDWIEVSNYLEAMDETIKELQNVALSSRLICSAHKTLLNHARGMHKSPGAYRTSQNWIGGKSLSEAVLVPPSPIHVPELMGDLEKFLHNRDSHIPILVRAAIAHYQFETIHPFLDGNGRIGRLLIILHLMDAGILDYPLLYISSWFERDRDLYYKNLMHTRTQHDMGNWIEYFLTGVKQIASESAKHLTDIQDLKTKTEQTIRNTFNRRAANAMKLLHHLFSKPVVSVDEASKVCGTTFRPTNDLIALMCQHQLLKEITGQSRNRLFLFSPLLQLFQHNNSGLLDAS